MKLSSVTTQGLDACDTEQCDRALRPSLGPLVIGAAGAWLAAFAIEALTWKLYSDQLVADLRVVGIIGVAGLLMAAVFIVYAPHGVSKHIWSFFRRCGVPICLVLAVAVCSFVFWQGWAFDVECTKELFQGSTVNVELSSDAVVRDYGTVSSARIVDMSHPVFVRIVWPEDAETLSAGHTVCLRGSLSVPQDSESGRWNHQNGYVGMVTVTQIEDADYTQSLRAMVTPFRDESFARIAQRGGQAAGLLAGILLGNKTIYSGSELEQDFRTTGLSHLMAVSGTHLAVVSALASWFLMRMRMRRIARLFALSIFLVFYVALTCFSASAIRSCVMCIAALMSGTFARRAHALSSLGLCVICFIALEPSVAFQIGFQLSVLAVLGIIVFSPLIASWLNVCVCERFYFVTDAISTTLSATLVTLPVTVALFAQFSLLSPFAMIVAGPLATLCLGLGIPALLIYSLFGPLGAFVLDVGSAIAGFFAWFIHVLADIPWACVPLDTNAKLLATTLTIVLVGMWIMWPLPCRLSTKPSRMLACVFLQCIPLIVLLLSGLGGLYGAAHVVGASFASTAELVMLDVGQGDSMLIRDGTSAVLIDTGEKGDVLKRQLARCGVTYLDAIYITHKDADHCGALSALAGVVRVDHVYIHADLLDYEGESDVLEAARWVTGHEAEGVRPGSACHIGSFSLTVVAPDKGGESENDDSLINLLEYDPEGDGVPNARALFSGDAEAAALEGIYQQIGDVDFVKQPHHGSSGGFSDAELDVLKPEFSLVSVGQNNDYGHPTTETLDMLSSHGIQVFRTDQQGAITVSFAPNKLGVSCQR